MPIQDTQNLNKNIQPRKVLKAVMKNIAPQDETQSMTGSATIITPVEKIMAGNTAQILVPLMGEIVDTKEIHRAAKASNLEGVNGVLNEFTLNLANRKSTKREYIVHSDGKEVGFDEIMLRTAAMGATVSTAINRNFYKTIVSGTVNGVDALDTVDGYTASSIKLQGKVVDASSYADPKAVVNGLWDEIDELCDIKDRFAQVRISETDLVLYATRKFARNFQKDDRYNVYDRKDNIGKRDWDANFDGVDVILTKQLPEGVDAILALKGSAGSIFLFENYVLADKVPGAQATLVGIDFKEGAGVWLPQYITVFSADVATYPVQARKTFSDLIVEMEQGQVQLENGNNDGPIDPINPIQPTVLPKFLKADIAPVFAGTDGAGTSTPTGPANVVLTATPADTLTNGDTVTITVAPADGYELATGQTKTFTFTVVGLA